MEFDPQVSEKIANLLGRFETKRSAILPALHVIQDHYGYIDEKHMELLETKFDLHRVWVREVATFYSMYRLKPGKKFRIYFCDNIVCTMRGAKPAMKRIQQYIDSVKHETGTDLFSLEGVPCLGVCDGAPAMLVNKDRHLNMDEDKVCKVLETYRTQKT